MEKLKLFLSLFCVCFPLTVVSVGVSLYPSKSIVAPLESTVFIICSFNRTQDTPLYWNISRALVLHSPGPRGITFETDTGFVGVSRLSLHLYNGIADLVYIQCQLCNALQYLCNTNAPAQNFIAATDPVQVVTFGSPLSLSHDNELSEAVRLSWSPPSVIEVFDLSSLSSVTYNIIIMESTNNSLRVTDINITNNTYVIISPADITDYTECTSYQWGVRAAVNLSYGFTNVTMANETFNLISGPKISDELIAIDDNYTIEFNVTSPCDIDLLNDYTYILLQKDYCQMPLNSSQINVSIPLEDNAVLPNIFISIRVNIGSLIHDSTWSVAVNVSNRFGSDTIDYTNITNNSEIIQNCNPIISSSVSQVSSSDILSSLITYTVFPISTLLFSFPTPSTTPSKESDRSGWTSTDTTLVVCGGVVLLCIMVVIYVIVYRVKNNRESYSCHIKNVVNEVKDFNVNGTSMVVESPRITVKSSPVDSADIVNEDYNNHHAETSFQTHMEYSTVVNTPVNTPLAQISETNPGYPVIDIELIQDMPGYTEVPVNMKKRTGSKKKQQTKNQNDPLPLAPNEEAEATPDSELATHQYADLDEIRRSSRRHAPLPTALNDVNY